jgi:hypothetical protein
VELLAAEEKPSHAKMLAATGALRRAATAHRSTALRRSLAAISHDSPNGKPEELPHRSTEIVRTDFRRLEVIHDPYLNRGTAFSADERERLGLRGLVPPRRQYLEQQVERIMKGLNMMTSPLGAFIVSLRSAQGGEL